MVLLPARQYRFWAFPRLRVVVDVSNFAKTYAVVHAENGIPDSSIATFPIANLAFSLRSLATVWKPERARGSLAISSSSMCSCAIP